VFVNMDLEAPPLYEHLGVVPEYLDPFEYENMRYRWYLQLKIPCNWKIAQEAFMEGYHVAATHTQLLAQNGEDYTTSFAHGKHSHFGYWTSQLAPGLPSPRLNQDPPKDVRPGIVEFFTRMEDTFRAIFTDRDAEAAKGIMDTLPPDVDAATAFAAAVELGRAAAEAEGCGYPPGLTKELLFKAGTGWNVFPNGVTLPYWDGAVWYRARPDGNDPDRCVFDIWSLKRYAPGKEPALERQFVDDPEGKTFGLIVDQDLGNMKRVQRGVKSRAFRYARPNPVQEVELITFHRALEEQVLGQARGAGSC
jgi:phenylpropionate dioxygenase-like ring-hydroxylating dioxygenase large terminal subunit